MQAPEPTKVREERWLWSCPLTFTHDMYTPTQYQFLEGTHCLRSDSWSCPLASTCLQTHRNTLHTHFICNIIGPATEVWTAANWLRQNSNWGCLQSLHSVFQCFLRCSVKEWGYTVRYSLSQTQWHRPLIPALRRLRHKDKEIEASLGYI